MIRYRITRQELERQIAAASPTWFTRAAARTQELKHLGHFEKLPKNADFWGDVKPVFMALQGGGKCAYCEREMESPETGLAEQDLMHFRPKGDIKTWKPSKALLASGVYFTKVPSGNSYYLLAYHPLNYAAACKPCNSTLKRDCFPIAGNYNPAGNDPTTLATERPYLIFPIGELDEDPENLIAFHGASPSPVAKSGHNRDRALVTIEFFRLDDPAKRKNLYRDRAILIMALFPLMNEGATGLAKVRRMLTPKLRHLNCARSYLRLFEADPQEARAVYESASQFVISNS